MLLFAPMHSQIIQNFDLTVLIGLVNQTLHSQQRMQMQMEDGFSSIIERLTLVEGRLTLVEGQLSSLREDLILAQNSQHQFYSDRLAIIEKASTIFTVENCSSFATTHFVAYKGRFASVVTPHLQCTPVKKIILSNFHDLGLNPTCPEEGKKALDISEYSIPKTGDVAMSFGYGNYATSWMGMVTGKTEQDIGVLNHWNMTAFVRQDEFILQGLKHYGQSGGAVSNGCGYLGIAHAMNAKVNLAYIIGAEHIVSLMKVHYSILPKCPGAVPIKLPKQPFVNCSSLIN